MASQTKKHQNDRALLGVLSHCWSQVEEAGTSWPIPKATRVPAHQWQRQWDVLGAHGCGCLPGSVPRRALPVADLQVADLPWPSVLSEFSQVMNDLPASSFSGKLYFLLSHLFRWTSWDALGIFLLSCKACLYYQNSCFPVLNHSREIIFFALIVKSPFSIKKNTLFHGPLQGWTLEAQRVHHNAFQAISECSGVYAICGFCFAAIWVQLLSEEKWSPLQADTSPSDTCS